MTVYSAITRVHPYRGDSSINHPIPLHRVEPTRQVERDASSGLPAHTLMRGAGSAVARWVLALYPHARQVWVAAGPGNNGGDGLDAAIHLVAAGKQVTVSHVVGAGDLPTDAQDALTRARAAGVSFVDQPPSLQTSDVALDALLGVGARRGPQGEVARRVQELNASNCPVLAVDIPTGLCADTGSVLGDSAVHARHTLSLLTLKPGLFTAHGRNHAGRVWWAPLGIRAQVAADAHLIGRRALRDLAVNHVSHKGTRGDTLIVGGAPGMAGAAWLAARAAHAAGSGRVLVSLLDTEASPRDCSRPELMVRPLAWVESLSLLDDLTVVAGCGGGSAIGPLLPRLLSVAPRVVLDADGLNAVASDPHLGDLLRQRATLGFSTILTPHPLEAARLMGCATKEIQADRLSAARELAQRFAALIVLKGSGTVIASAHETPWINLTGGPALATAGTGDVLAGWLGGSWASAIGPHTNTSNADTKALMDTALETVYLHGLAADLSGVTPIRAADLVDAMLQTRSQAQDPSINETWSSWHA